MSSVSHAQAPIELEPDAHEELRRRIVNRGHCAIVGLQWGDEGKGKIVDLLTRDYDVVVRYNGGANAGHSVVVANERYALHLIPSGILYPEKTNVVANGVVVDPAQMIAEIDGLRDRGIEIGDNLRLSDRAHLVMPYHKLQDGLMEQALSRARGDNQKIGTTGRGIGPCYADKAQRATGIRAGALLDPDRFRRKVAEVVAIKNVLLEALARSCDEPYEQIDAGALADEYLGYADRLGGHICDSTRLLHDAMSGGQRLLFEGANATLLDIDHGTYPFVTSSNCSSLGVHTGAGIPGHCVRSIVGIVKAYQTRVGGGPMVTELKDETGDRIREAGREYGTTTGRPRRCGWLDLVAIRYSAEVSGATSIALMLLDVLSGFDRLKICVGYRHQGRKLDGFPSDAGVLAGAEPIYDEVEGFAEPVCACRRFDELPEAARSYVRYIEKFVGVPVQIISVGPRRDQTIVRQEETRAK
ncbi:MAG: adenylosuccinate synthase [Phycisphaeraceae bacterium]|nr:adenylosuccinate synthase [Phycisphaeraceae bacterium]